jgi:branched-chain amino acid transport system ATP-binding protein
MIGERSEGADASEPDGSAVSAGSARRVALNVKSLSVSYGNVVAVHDATFAVAEGDACAITGPNGNGKSSILMGVTGMVRRRGGVEIFGKRAPNGDVGWAARNGLTLVPERRQLYPDLSANDNIILGCYSWTRSIARARNSAAFGRAIDLFPELKPHLKQAAGTLSGGQQQMVAIARTLLNANRMLLVDEPTKGLAPKVVTEVAGVLERAAAVVPILLVEQNLALVRRLTDRAVLIAEGRVAHTGRLSEAPDRVHALLGVART